MLIIISFLIIVSIVSVDSDPKSDRINEIRKSVLKYFSLNPELAYQSDIDFVSQKNGLIDCFLNPFDKNTSPDRSLIQSLKAWKAGRISEQNDTSFPSEFFALGHIYEFGLTKNGKHILGSNMAFAPPIGKIDSVIGELAIKFISYQLRKLIFKSGGNSFVAYINFGGPRMMDNDIVSFREFIRLMKLHWPCMPAKTYVYNLNGLLVALVRTVLSQLLPNYETIAEFPTTEAELEIAISLDEIPVHNGGRNTNFVFIPEGVKSGKCLPEFKNNKGIWDSLKDLRIDCFLQSLKISGKSSLEEFIRIREFVYEKKESQEYYEYLYN